MVHGVNKEKLEDVKAIIIHSTANVGVGVEGHITWSKNDPNALMTMYYVDSKTIGKTTKDGMAGFGIKNYNGYKNSNTISIEMTEATTQELQNKTIDNTVWLVRELMKKYPNAEIKFHSEVNDYGKICPRILQDGVGVEEKEFREMLGI